jgi:tetratricopeptide (TPR) repeat protein
MDPAAAQAVLEQFVALGYVQPQTEGEQKAVESAVREGKYNLARDYMDCRQHERALPLMEELYRDRPTEIRFTLQLAQCYQSLGRNADARSLLGRIVEQHKEPSSQNGESSEKYTEAQPAALAWADWLRGAMDLSDGKTEDGLALLLRAEKAQPLLPNLHVRLGETYLRLKRNDEAQRAFQRALEIDGDSPEAHVGLSMVHLRRRRFEDAASESLIAVGLQHFSPLGHFNLGIALSRLGQYERAKLAFETALTILPGLAVAHRYLSVLYAKEGGDNQRSARHRFLFDQLREKERLHRSGT